jgi:hypothetical protein
MSRFFVVLGIIVILAIGAYRLLARRKRLVEKNNFSIEYLTKLKQYVDSRGRDGDTFGWLIHQSVKMQSHMGQLGVMDFKPPAANYYIRNFQLIINGVPELPKAFQEDQFFTTINLANQYSSLLMESIVRYHGVLDESLKDVTKDLKNPIVIFREGVKAIISLPLYLLEWLGLGGNAIMNSSAGRLLIRLITGIVSLTAFVSAVVSLVVGWDSFVTILKKYLPFLCF